MSNTAGGVPVSAEERRAMNEPTTDAGRALLEAFLAKPADPDYSIRVSVLNVIRYAVPRIEAEARAGVSVPTEPGAPDPSEPDWTLDGLLAALRNVRTRSYANGKVTIASDHFDDLLEIATRIAASRPVPAPEPSARLLAELDDEMAGTEDWTEGPDDYLDVRIGLVRRIRAALAATPQDPEALSHPFTATVTGTVGADANTSPPRCSTCALEHPAPQETR